MVFSLKCFISNSKNKAVALLGLTAAGICMIQGLAGSWVVKEENAATKNGVHLQMYLSYPVIFFWFGFVPLLFVASMKLLAAVNLLLATKTVNCY